MHGTHCVVKLCSVLFFFQNASQDFYTRLELRALLTAKAHLEKETLTPAYLAVRRQYLVQLPNEREFIIKRDTLARIQGRDFSGIFPLTL